MKRLKPLRTFSNKNKRSRGVAVKIFKDFAQLVGRTVQELTTPHTVSDEFFTPINNSHNNPKYLVDD